MKTIDENAQIKRSALPSRSSWRKWRVKPRNGPFEIVEEMIYAVEEEALEIEVKKAITSGTFPEI